MFKKLKPEVQLILDRLGRADILNHVFVKNQFHKRGLQLQDAGIIKLVFKGNGFVYVNGESSTCSRCCEIAIMKSMIKDNILDNENNFI